MGAGLIKFTREIKVLPAAGVTKYMNSVPFPAHLASRSLRRLDAWLGLSQTTQRDWGQRLPAVAAASLALTAYAWSAGLEPVGLQGILVLGLAAAVLGYFTDGK